MDLGDDATFLSVIAHDAQGRNFIEQREAWREGSDFPFTAEFFATIDSEAGVGDGDSSVANGVVIDSDVIDTEEVSVDTV
jgi:hypothetical protein